MHTVTANAAVYSIIIYRIPVFMGKVIAKIFFNSLVQL